MATGVWHRGWIIVLVSVGWFLEGCSDSAGAGHDAGVPHDAAEAASSRDGDLALDGLPDGGFEVAVETVRVSGMVDRSQIGGRALAVRSSWDDPQTVRPDGTFDVKVSAVAPQGLLVEDGDGVVRGLAISFGGSESIAKPLRFDARSTALGLVMFVQGISPVVPARAVAVATELEHTESFDVLVTLLERHLSSDSVGDTIGRQDVAAAMSAVVHNWIDAFGGPRPTATEPGSGWNFGAELIETTNDKAHVKVSNYAPRYLNLYRRLLAQDGSTIKVSALATSFGAMPGPGPFASGVRTTLGDVIDLQSGARTVEYWITGLGILNYGAPLPADLPSEAVSHFADVLALTLADYVISSWVRLWLGVVELPSGWKQTLHLVVRRQVNLTRLVTATNEDEARAALESTLLELMDLSLRLTALLAVPLASPLHLVFRMIRGLQASAELLALGIYYRLLPPVANVSLPLPQVSPADGGVDVRDGGMEPGVGTFWTAVFSSEGPRERTYSCRSQTPCGSCPDSPNVWLLGVPGSLSLPPLEVRRDGDVLQATHFTRGQIGTFQVEDTEVRLEGTVLGDQIDITLTFAGKAAYAGEPTPFSRAGRWEGTLTLENGAIEDGHITGAFLWNASVRSAEETCSTFDYRETNQGTARICIDDCK